MCIRPWKDAENVDQALPCGECWQCKATRINDLVGRALAEKIYSDRTVVVTLTYRDSADARSKVLDYRDVQLALKKLRNDGFVFKYMVAGEYGEKKGRSHWHMALFFRGKFPFFVVDEDWRQTVDWWPHGYIYAQSGDARSFHYLLKYAVKSAFDEHQQRSFRLSKYPMIGHDFIVDQANRIFDAGLALAEPSYSFAGVKDRHGKSRVFWLTGAGRVLYYETFLARLRDSGKPVGKYVSKYVAEKYLTPQRREAMFKHCGVLFPPMSTVEGPLLLFEDDGQKCSAAKDAAGNMVIMKGDNLQWRLSLNPAGNIPTQLKQTGLSVTTQSLFLSWLSNRGLYGRDTIAKLC